MFPKGVIIYCVCVLGGINLGRLLQAVIPERIKKSMKVFIGISAVVVGITAIVKCRSLPAVVMALIFGALIGEFIDLDKIVCRIFEKLLSKFNFQIKGNEEDYMKFFLTVVVTLCASGTNIFGAINEGMSEDSTILLSKAVMDIVATMIFASSLGRALNLIVPIQCISLISFFYLAHVLMPFATEIMLNDFVAMGGVITLILGLNMAQIKQIKAMNLLPALLLIWPFSWLYCLIF